MKRKKSLETTKGKELLKNILLPEDIVSTILGFYAKKGFFEFTNTMNISKSTQINMLPYIINVLNKYDEEYNHKTYSFYEKYSMLDPIYKFIYTIIQKYVTKMPDLFSKIKFDN